ncbi:M17 family metallopeptidase [Actinotalea sp. K2]|uniref:leucyl aminopeptidase family protein n=1 Tax=Actinotalea sp. K2 TaxID=2939438 RepID=UPI002016B400|nr:M17 family peptidase N-terminal domain-containing protein [Actinotalea sp. K2]MCL3861898.1 leucyl aminopeptidase [Actinotalea sp. K2]
MARRPNKLIPESFTPVPSERARPAVTVVDDLSDVDVVGVVVHTDGAVPDELGLSREALTRTGFDAKVGSALVLPTEESPFRVAVGGGPLADQGEETLRDAAAALGRAAPRAEHVGLRLPALGGVDPQAAAQALTEGVVLSRYRYAGLKSSPTDPPLAVLRLRLDGAELAEAGAGAATGSVTARATSVARDLTNTPAAHLTAPDLADVAVELGRTYGFDVEVFDEAQLIAMGCGGLLGVNRGSVEEARLIKLVHAPEGGRQHLTLVGKGIMYDSGGISLKPSDPMHLLMKMDMGGAAAILGAFTALRESGVACRVTGFLACTDNVPSGGAYVLGDVLHTRGGTTIEVKNTDAEGRLVMSDALVLATEEAPSAVVTVATLTGAALAALGPAMAVTLGNDQALVDRVRAAADATDERVWQLPLERRYRKQLDSDVADISNLGGPYAGAITAALFLEDFVDDVPWAHLDICGPMQAESDEAWRSKGATGFGARLLLELARGFESAAPGGSTDGGDLPA